MANQKGYFNEIEEYVIEAYSDGYLKEEEIIAYVLKRLSQAKEKDVKIVVDDFFDFVRDEICS